MNKFLLLVLALASAVPVTVHATDLAAFQSARDSLRTGVNHGRASTVLVARAGFEALAGAEPDSVELDYWIAVCDWRATPLAMRGGSSHAIASAICDHGLAALERVLKRSPRHAGALALKGGLLGLSLSFREASAAMTLGPQMVALFAQARAIAPDDPRVAFLAALNTLHMPEFYGGGTKKALPEFEHAVELFDHAMPAGPLAPTWGHDDALLWAGQCAARLGEVNRARALYERALGANPDNGWVRTELLPALDAPAPPKAEEGQN